MDRITLLWWTIASMAVMLIAISLSGITVLFETTPILSTIRKWIKREQDNEQENKSIFNPYQILLGGFFIATVLFFIPGNYFAEFNGEASGIREIKTFFISLVDTVKVIVVDGDYKDYISNVLETFNSGNCLFSNIYSIYGAVIFIAGPILVAGFILSFFKEAISLFRLRFHRCRKYLYIMSELNARSLVLARDIVNDEKAPRYQKLIVFTDVFEKDDDRVHELISEAKHLGALCVKRDITGINLKYMAKDKYRKLYFLSENEEKNIKQALRMIQNATCNECCNVYETELYVFARTIESEALLDSVDKKNIKVRRINENKNLVYKAMVEHPIYNDTLISPCDEAICNIKKIYGWDELKLELEKEDKTAEEKNELEAKLEKIQLKIKAVEDKKTAYMQNKEIPLNIAIIGLGGYGIELLKTICWQGQVEGYHVNIHAFENGAGEEKIKLIAPELIEYNHKSKLGNSDYDIHFYDKENVTKAKFFEDLSAIDDLTSIYVTLGDDELNIQTAMRIRSYLARKSNINAFIPIYAVVFSQVKTDMLKSGRGLKPSEKEEYKITFIGSLRDLCELETIEQKTNEEIALRGHMYWSEFYDTQSKEDRIKYENDEAYRQEKKSEAHKKFEKYEYYRKSSMGEAVFYRTLREAKISPCKDLRNLGKVEHARWNVFMRAEGFVYDDAKSFVKKTHNDLVDFERLSPKEQEKDLFYDSKMGRIIIGERKEDKK